MGPYNPAPGFSSVGELERTTKLRTACSSAVKWANFVESNWNSQLARTFGGTVTMARSAVNVLPEAVLTEILFLPGNKDFTSSFKREVSFCIGKPVNLTLGWKLALPWREKQLGSSSLENVSPRDLKKSKSQWGSHQPPKACERLCDSSSGSNGSDFSGEHSDLSVVKGYGSTTRILEKCFVNRG